MSIGVFVQWGSKPKTGQEYAGYIIDGNGCHIWVGTDNNRGYGTAWDRAAGKKRLVHRVRYEREVGPIPEGLVLDHYVCDNGAGGCCNPLHCRPVTHRENALRGNSPASWQLAQTHCKRGHPLSGENLYSAPSQGTGRSCVTCRREYGVAYSTAKRRAAGVAPGRCHGETHYRTSVTEADVLLMRQEAQAGASVVGIAKRFGVAYSMAWSAIRGGSWSHLPGAVAPRRGNYGRRST